MHAEYTLNFITSIELCEGIPSQILIFIVHACTCICTCTYFSPLWNVRGHDKLLLCWGCTTACGYLAIRLLTISISPSIPVAHDNTCDGLWLQERSCVMLFICEPYDMQDTRPSTHVHV